MHFAPPRIFSGRLLQRRSLSLSGAEGEGLFEEDTPSLTDRDSEYQERATTRALL